MKTTPIALKSQNEKSNVVSGRSSSDNRGGTRGTLYSGAISGHAADSAETDSGTSGEAERAAASVPDSVELREVGEHEPGPWKVSLVDGYLMVHAPDHESDKYIAEVANGADARLISAAPELLEVAKRLLGLAQDLHFTGSLIDLAEAAISKAEGR